MPHCPKIKEVLSSSTVYNIILVLSLAVSGTSLGLLEANVYYGQVCIFFLNEKGNDDSAFSCKLSLASIAIATICLSILATIQLVRVVFQASIKTVQAKIFQVVLFVITIVFLIITAIVVSAGWGKTWTLLKKWEKDSYHCTGTMYMSQKCFKGKEIIASAVLAGLGLIFTMANLHVFIIQQKMKVSLVPIETENNTEYEELLLQE